MKPHKIIYLFLVCLIAFSCKKNDEGDTEIPNLGGSADYTLLVKTASGFEAVLLDADADQLTFNPSRSDFPMTTAPDLNFKQGTVYSFLRNVDACNATFLNYDFENEKANEVNLFADLGTCNLTTHAVAHYADTGYVAYALDNGVSTGYYVRSFNLNGPSDDFSDIVLTKRPIHLSFANNRLFVLTLDDAITNENFLTVVDAQTNGVLIELNLGYDAQKLLRNNDDNVIISYDELHTLMNSETLAPEYVQYQSGLEPEFVASAVNNFGDGSKMYYERPSGIHSSYPIIPAAYDFEANLTTLYPFEAYLTQQERDFEYKIETTSMVGYDKKNGYMLIGYKKTGQANKGGLLRVRTGDNPAVIDNIDIDGIPFNIIVM